MITTAITNAAEPFTERIIKTAARLGIKSYRLGWFSYKRNENIAQNIQAFNQTFLQLQQLNEKHQIHGAYQNHAGESFGSPVIDFAMALNNINPAWIGCQYDIRHATVEGANSWPIGLTMVKDYVKTINIKDFKWTQKDGIWKVENVPLGEGMVNFKRYFEQLKSCNFTGPVCIHYEYALGGAEDGANKITVEPETVYKAMRTDLGKLKRWLSETS